MTFAPSRRLTLKEVPESAPVKEAKAACAGIDTDPALVAFALRLVEARDHWRNRAKTPRWAPRS